MINIEDFTKRLKKVIEYYDLSASAFADTLGVQRSSISHILSGRNKPSLEFVMKILQNFPEVELYWLLNGKGNFPRTVTSRESIIPPPMVSMQPKEDTRQHTLALDDPISAERQPQNVTTGKTIERIVIFYTDGTFEDYQK